MSVSLIKKLALLTNRILMIPSKIEALESELNRTYERMKELEKAGLIYGRVHWRGKKYMLIVSPMKNGERPNPTYIGSDPAKIKDAEEGILRAVEYDQLQDKAKAFSQTIDEATRALSRIELALSL